MLCPFRDMALLRAKLPHTFWSEPLTQPVNQLRQGFRLACRGVDVQSALTRAEPIRSHHVHGGCFETELGIEATGLAFQPQGQEAQYVLDVAAWRGEAEIEL